MLLIAFQSLFSTDLDMTELPSSKMKQTNSEKKKKKKKKKILWKTG